MIIYQQEANLTVSEFTDLLKRSTLGERRPVNQPDRISLMLKNANLVVCARDEGKLVGVVRSLTDYSFCTYMSDLAVDENYQKMGIGRELIKYTKSMTPLAKLILLAAPNAVNYYPHIGMKRHEFCFFIDDLNELQ